MAGQHVVVARMLEAQRVADLVHQHVEPTGLRLERAACCVVVDLHQRTSGVGIAAPPARANAREIEEAETDLCLRRVCRSDEVQRCVRRPQGQRVASARLVGQREGLEARVVALAEEAVAHRHLGADGSPVVAGDQRIEPVGQWQRVVDIDHRLDVGKHELGAVDADAHGVQAFVGGFADAVVAIAQQIGVVACAADEPVRAWSTCQRVVASAAEQAVVTRAATQAVVARLAVKVVNAITAEQAVAAVGTEQRVAARAAVEPGADLARVELQRHIPGAALQVVITVATEQCVAAVAAEERVVACAAVEQVVAGFA